MHSFMKHRTLSAQGLGMRLFETRSDSVTGKRSVVMGYGRGPRSGATLEIVSPPRGGAPKVRQPTSPSRILH
jgi:hypothetical protein